MKVSAGGVRVVISKDGKPERRGGEALLFGCLSSISSRWKKVLISSLFLPPHVTKFASRHGRWISSKSRKVVVAKRYHVVAMQSYVGLIFKMRDVSGGPQAHFAWGKFGCVLFKFQWKGLALLIGCFQTTLLTLYNQFDILTSNRAPKIPNTQELKRDETSLRMQMPVTWNDVCKSH